jgi:glycosyltransferase involved in cell wall biosynthesis
MGAVKLSACIITLNEADRIGACLTSLDVADEIVVVDSGSEDRTREICRERGARVIDNAWPGHVEQKNHAIENAAHDWVLCIDADERLSDELRAAIRAWKEAEPDAPGYALNRHTEYLGRWIDHCGWYPQWRVRLFDRRRGRWVGTNPHDRVEVDGTAGRIAGDLNHHTYRDLRDHLRTIDNFTTIAAKERHASGKRFNPFAMLFGAWWRTTRIYVFRLGFLDGVPGLILAVMAGYYVFLKHAKLFELQRRAGAEARR